MPVENNIAYSKSIYQFCLENNPNNSDTFQMLQMLLNWKDSDLLWIVKSCLKKIKSFIVDILIAIRFI
ncbi:hypothetical protein RhiirA4_450906 [Rhizophagus irregularis]|uniref:Uncharacterized protein n=1 Tax=Rhizophagus irregularis TaxID=588596 RepID=A0A2I1FUD4_9GLOM|nr:hypothetical protein RhiirA4_450906 [Rhizophagus irregularis]